jgi:ArsR family transcriptional regulator
MKQLEKILKAAADRNRLRILNMLQDRPLCVCEITAVLQLSQSTVSGHLRILKDAGLVLDSKSGLWVEYQLNATDGVYSRLLNLVREAAASDPAMKKERERARRADREVLCRK